MAHNTHPSHPNWQTPSYPAPPDQATPAPALALPSQLQAMNLSQTDIAALLAHFQAGNMPFPPPPPPPPLTAAPPQYMHTNGYNPTLYPVPPPPPSLATMNQAQHIGWTGHAQESAGPVMTTGRQEELGIPSSAVNNGLQPEREDGELSDVSSYPSSKRPRVSPPLPDRIAGLRNKTRGRKSSNSVPKLNSQNAMPHSPTSSAHPTTPNPALTMRRKKEVVLPFLNALHQEGFTYVDMVQEGYDIDMLQEAYRELRLPISPDIIVGSRAGSEIIPQLEIESKASPAAATTSTSLKPRQASAEKSSQPAASTMIGTNVAKAPAPVNRQDYLARLQAAKTKKLGAAPEKEPPAEKSMAGVQPATTAIDVKNAPTPSANTPSDSTKSAGLAPSANKQLQLTELARKKMEALKSMQKRLAAKKDMTLSAVPQLTASPKEADTSKSGAVDEITATPSSNQALDADAQELIESIHEQTIATERAAPLAASLAGDIPGLQTGGSRVSSETSTPAQKASLVFHEESMPDDADQAPLTGKGRKRPVAADLNDAEDSEGQRPYKRPFGQSRRNSSDNAMIIEVSDDEGTVANEESSSLPLGGSTVSSLGTTRQKSIRNLPPLTDFPQRSTNTQINSLGGPSTPLVSTPGTVKDIEELKRKEREIIALNLRIQEIEKRKAALKNKEQSPSSRPSTPTKSTPRNALLTAAPASSTSSQQPTTTPGGPVSSFIDSRALNAKTPISDKTTNQLQQPSTPTTPLSLDRRIKLQAALSARELEINNRQAQILEMQRQIAELQQKDAEDKHAQEQLREELESIDIDTEGMSHTEMQAKRDEIEEIMQNPQNVTEPGLNESEDLMTRQSLRNEADSDGEFEPTDTVHDMVFQQQQPGPSVDNTSSDDRSVYDDIAKSGLGKNPDIVPLTAASVSDHADAPTAQKDVLQEETNASNDGRTDEPALLYVRNIPFDTIQDDVAALFADYNVLKVDVPAQDTREGFALVTLPLSQAVTAIDQLNGLVFHDCSLVVQMSHSNRTTGNEPSTTTTPAVTDTPLDESSSGDEMDTDTSSDSDSDSESDDDNGEYDPPETMTVADQVQPQPGSLHTDNDMIDTDASIVRQDTPDENAQSSEMDLDSSSDESSPAVADSATAIPPGISDRSRPDHTNEELTLQEQNIADDLAPELQPGVEQQMQVKETPSHDTARTPSRQFVPYESVLKVFKKYRFHPDYLKDATGGYRSLTYSHQIDVEKSLCRFESAAGVCNDRNCEYQHFRDMDLIDDDLLLQFGLKAANPGKSTEEINDFNLGLRQTIQQLRVEEIKDIEVVAARIARYRRDYLKDPANILGL